MAYIDYANTDQQKEIAQLMEEGITGEAIAKKVGKDPGNVRKVMALLKQRAAPKSIPEHSGTIPDGYKIKAPLHFTKMVSQRCNGSRLIRTPRGN